MSQNTREVGRLTLAAVNSLMYASRYFSGVYPKALRVRACEARGSLLGRDSLEILVAVELIADRLDHRIEAVTTVGFQRTTV